MKAKQSKASALENLEDKLDSKGRSLLSVKTESISKEMQLQQMIKRIQDTLDGAAEMGALKTKSFFFIHVNTMCKVVI